MRVSWFRQKSAQSSWTRDNGVTIQINQEATNTTHTFPFSSIFFNFDQIKSDFRRLTKRILEIGKEGGVFCFRSDWFFRVKHLNGCLVAPGVAAECLLRRFLHDTGTNDESSFENSINRCCFLVHRLGEKNRKLALQSSINNDKNGCVLFRFSLFMYKCI